MAEKLVKDSQCLAKDLVNDCISRREAIDIVNKYNKSHMRLWGKPMIGAAPIVTELEDLPSAQPENTRKRTESHACDCIERQAAIDAVLRAEALVRAYGYRYAVDAVRELPPVQPEKETAKRVLWTGWKGTRNTRYKCPNCKKPVKNDDVYCHRCGQKLMFPHISFTDYIPGEKQELIVRWDDEE